MTCDLFYVKCNQQQLHLTKKLETNNAAGRLDRKDAVGMEILCKYYSRKESLNAPNNDLLKGTYPGKCNICDCILNNNIELTSHICSHLEGSNYISPFDAVTTICSVCDTEFDNPFELIMHLDLEHMKQLDEYKCRICERQHKNLNELVKHLQMVHTKHEIFYTKIPAT